MLRVGTLVPMLRVGTLPMLRVGTVFVPLRGLP